MNVRVGLECKGCDEQMLGIRDYGARRLCQECGGNKSPYNEENPHPESPHAKK